MDKENKNNAALLLRLPEELKAALQRQAALNGRRITSEINIRLRNSLDTKEALPASYQAAHITPAHQAGEDDKNNALVLSPADHAMLDVFRRMPADKQLALLSLFK